MTGSSNKRVISKVNKMKGMITYRIEQNHSFVHDLEVAGHHAEVVAEFVHEVLDFHGFNLNNERIRQFHMLS